MSAKITSLTQSVTSSEPVQELTSDNAAITKAFDRWEGEMAAFRGKPWSQSPAAFVADFARAAAKDLLFEYGPGATHKAGTLLAVQLASRNLSGVDLAGRYAAGGAFVHLAFEKVKDTGETVENTFDVTLPEGTDPEEAIEALRNWGKNEAQATRFVLDPIESLGDDDILGLTARVEALLGAHEKPDDIDVLSVVSAVLVVWRHLETINASTGTLSFFGLSDGGDDVWSGEGMQITLEAKLLDVVHDNTDFGEDPVEVTVSHRSRKM
jgi:hypothetical protein